MRVFSMVLAFIVLAGFALSIPKAAYACSCAIRGGESEEELTRQATAGAQAVFAGEVSSIEDPSEPSPGDIVSSADPVKVTFDVSQVWKGPKDETVAVETPRSGASCGYDFEEGSQYLVYADNTSVMGEKSEALQVGLCGGTSQVSNASAATLLGESGTVPGTENPGSQPQQDNAGLPNTGGLPLSGLASIGGVALIASGLLLRSRMS
jgi:hypothetical protein